MAHRVGLQVLALWLTAITSVASKGWLADNYPNPQLWPQKCGRPNADVNTTWVCDPDGLISTAEQADNLDHTLTQLKETSRCECDKNCDVTGGYQVAIALARRMGIEGNYVPDRQRARDFAEDLREQWFGQEGCQDNAVILYSSMEKELFIAIGKQTAEVVSDIELGQIYHQSSDYFHHGDSDLYEGLVYALTELHEAIDNDWFLTYGVMYAITISIATVLLFSTMCLVANCCASQSDFKTEDLF
ncbi:uncharacterized protein [Ptychodera flava]|uniref:uncharacterized protein n=1 Tax=Ptychodera flava TaxID=63121 RepID=UPI003969DD9D